MKPAAVPRVRRWSLSRDRDHPERNEDASCAQLAFASGGWTAFLAVADGAGSTLFAGEWAQALVDAAGPAWVSGDLAPAIGDVRRRFDPLANGEYADDFVLRESWLEIGSAATLAVALVRSREGVARSRVVIVGDCLLVVSEADRLTSFPYRSSTQFTNRTEAVRSDRADVAVNSWTGRLAGGSMMALASDSVGAWLLRRYENEGPGSVHDWLATTSVDALPDVDDDISLIVLDVPAG